MFTSLNYYRIGNIATEITSDQKRHFDNFRYIYINKITHLSICVPVGDNHGKKSGNLV